MTHGNGMKDLIFVDARSATALMAAGRFACRTHH
jgi:hypothetical protein